MRHFYILSRLQLQTRTKIMTKEEEFCHTVRKMPILESTIKDGCPNQFGDKHTRPNHNHEHSYNTHPVVGNQGPYRCHTPNNHHSNLYHNHSHHRHRLNSENQFRRLITTVTTSWSSYRLAPSSLHNMFTLFTCVVLLLAPGVPGARGYDVCMDPENNILHACHPSISDAANSPTLKLSLSPADATCGTPASTYERMGDRTNRQYTCDARSTTGNAHPLTNIVDRDTASWWQSVGVTPGQTDLHINLTLSFNKLYRFAGDLVLNFNSGRPEKMILEKSMDYGATWTPLQFYARVCNEFADEVNVSAVVTKDNPTAVICTNRYIELRSEPRPGTRVNFDLQSRFNMFLTPTNEAPFFQALDAQFLDFLIFSDLRIRFMRPASDGRGNWNEYYYAIQDLNVIARCYCNLHASSCSSSANGLICDCQHNTQGKNCEECLPLYNERPWQRGSYLPFNQGMANECKKCECNDHADACAFDPSYGRGVCTNCTHNTTGKHCEACQDKFYPNMSMPLNSTERCLACDCEALGVTGNSASCAQSAVAPNQIGQCMCKDKVTGRQCNACIPGYYGLLQEPNLGNCTACECDLDGTEGQSNTCAQNGGQCPCKTSTTGRQCNTCADEYFDFPRGVPQQQCKPCVCNVGGSTNLTCNKVTGVCACKPGISGDKCDKAEPGSYVPAVDVVKAEPASGGCAITSDLYTDAAPIDGSGFANCELSTSPLTLTFASLPGAMIQPALQWPYYPAIRYTNKASQTVMGKMTITTQGVTTQPLSPLSTRLGQVITPACPTTTPIERDVMLAQGTSTAVLLTSEPVIMDARCKFGITLTLQPPTPATGRRKRQAVQTTMSVQIDSVTFLPALNNSDQSTTLAVYDTSADKAAVMSFYQNCLEQVAKLTTRDGAMSQPPCDQILFGVASDIHGQASTCSCNTVGSQFSTQCSSLGGQCSCKPGVGGRTCDACLPGYFNFTADGCTACNCYDKGSQHGACDANTGQCPCKANILTAATATDPQDKEAGRTCQRCLANFYGIDQGQGCTACACNSQGSTSLQCDETGQCPCKDSVQGVKCDTCKDTYYGFGPNGCSFCNCSEAGSTSLNCNQATGVCDCKANVQGNKCSQCKAQMFNLATTNPKGCQPCFCFMHGQECDSASGFTSDRIRINGSAGALDLSSVIGRRHSSYGTELSLGFTARFALNIENEILVTFQGHGKSMYLMARATTTIPRDATLVYKVRLLEAEWKKEENGNMTDITAVEMMEILASLSKITYLTRSKGQNIQLTYFDMEVTKEDKTGMEMPVSSVESCTCLATAHVAGLSCEDCSTGYRRPNASAPSSYDTCTACNCNNRGATTPPECDQVTGICLNCRNGTMGDQCESCAANVTGANCDTCVSGYWGLAEDGCRPCECSSPGSQSMVCDANSGQCTCAANVIGRTCDQCEENFHSMTSSGCIECDQCYSLLKAGVGNLRTLRDTLARNVSMIQERNNSNLETKPFTVRFQETVDNTNKLISFIDSAKASESQVQAQITAFNSSLTTLENQLTRLDNATMPEIEGHLTTAGDEIRKAMGLRANLEAGAKEANSKLVTLGSQSVRLTNLANDIKTAKDTLQSLADASTADRAILAELDTLNTTVVTANELAKDILEKAQAALEIQKNTTGRLLSLESSVISLAAKASQTTSSATQLATQSSETSTTIARLQANLATLTAFVIDFASLKSRIDSAKAITSSEKMVIITSQAAFGGMKTRAAATVDVVKDLANRTNVIGSSAADWITRSRKAEEQSQMISQRAKDIFDQTEATLVLLRNFKVRAQDIESQANAKLAQVSSVQTLSQKLIADSKTLTDSLSSLQQTTTSAKEASEQAKQTIQNKLSQIEGIGRLATDLKNKLADVDPGAARRLQAINAARKDALEPGDKVCTNLTSRLTSFNSELVKTDNTTTTTLETVGNTTERANAILKDLRGLEKVDASAASTLYNQVMEAQTKLSVEDLTATINGLLATKASQRAEIDRLIGVKDTLKQKINNLKLLLQQIRPATLPT